MYMTPKVQYSRMQVHAMQELGKYNITECRYINYGIATFIKQTDVFNKLDGLIYASSMIVLPRAIKGWPTAVERNFISNRSTYFHQRTLRTKVKESGDTVNENCGFFPSTPTEEKTSDRLFGTLCWKERKTSSASISACFSRVRKEVFLSRWLLSGEEVHNL